MTETEIRRHVTAIVAAWTHFPAGLSEFLDTSPPVQALVAALNPIDPSLFVDGMPPTPEEVPSAREENRDPLGCTCCLCGKQAPTHGEWRGLSLDQQGWYTKGENTYCYKCLAPDHPTLIHECHRILGFLLAQSTPRWVTDITSRLWAVLYPEEDERERIKREAEERRAICVRCGAVEDGTWGDGVTAKRYD